MSETELTVQQRLLDKLELFREIVKYEGGDFEIAGFENGVLTLRLLGACAHCINRTFTYDEGIKQALLHDFPDQIKDVRFIV